MAKTLPVPGATTTAADLVRLAMKMAEQQQLVQRQELERARREDAAKFASQGKTIEAKYAGLADLFKGRGDEVDGRYASAAGDVSGFAKGYSDEFRAGVNSRADSLNALLGQNGLPQRIQGDVGGGDVMYGLRGFTPAAGLRAAGAAYGAAADNLPDVLRVKGAQDSTASLFAGAERDKQYRDKQGDLLAQLPGLVQQNAMTLGSLANQARATDVQEQYLLLNQGKTQGIYTDPRTGQQSLLPGYTQAKDGTIVPPGYSYNPTTGQIYKTPTGAQAPAAKKAAAIAKRNDATVNAFEAAAVFMDGQFKEAAGTEPKEAGRVPLQGPPLKLSSGTTTAQYWRKDGSLTTNPKDPNIATKPIYEQVPLPKPAYDRLFRRVYADFRRQLKRFGYKDAQLKEFAFDVMDDYYEIVGGQAPNPTVPDRTGPPPNKR